MVVADGPCAMGLREGGCSVMLTMLHYVAVCVAIHTPHLRIAAAGSGVGPSVARWRRPEQTANHTVLLLLLVAAGLLLIAPVLLLLLTLAIARVLLLLLLICRPPAEVIM